MRKFLKYLIYLLLFLLLLIIGSWKYFNYQFDKRFDEERYNELKSTIQNSAPLPDNFLKTYKEQNTITDLKGLISDQFHEKYHRNCPCFSLSLTVLMSNSIERFILTHRLEKDFTQEQCLEYLSSIRDFYYDNKGIINASQFYFKKNLEDLNETEIQTLVLMLKNPILYNPIKYPETLKMELEKINANTSN